MRALSMASVSAETFISLVTTCSTNAPTHCFAVSRSSSVGARRPSRRILSSKLPSSLTTMLANGFAGSAMLNSLPRPGIRFRQTDFGTKFIQFLIIIKNLLQHLLQLVITVEAAAQVELIFVATQ